LKSLNSDNCALCSSHKYPIIWANDLFRIVLINDQNYRGYCRVDLINHIKEMSDLDEAIRNEFMGVIFQMEKIVKEYLQPDKINLASLGNITPHLHWHIIPRYLSDNHFPDSIWSEKKRNDINKFSKVQELKFIKHVNNKLNQ
jgi:diadenosine tetraphosphate (Ap4A) HIT family hydrolase|tara:strand:+ start:260 stop:688 length:429 start_codon:yes stop_codon:yes gene_type:complete